MSYVVEMQTIFFVLVCWFKRIPLSYFASENKSSKLKYYSITRKQSETTGTCESYKYNSGCFRLVLLHTDIFEI